MTYKKLSSSWHISPDLLTEIKWSLDVRIPWRIFSFSRRVHRISFLSGHSVRASILVGYFLFDFDAPSYRPSDLGSKWGPRNSDWKLRREVKKIKDGRGRIHFECCCYGFLLSMRGSMTRKRFRFMDSEFTHASEFRFFGCANYRGEINLPRIDWVGGGKRWKLICSSVAKHQSLHSNSGDEWWVPFRRYNA